MEPLEREVLARADGPVTTSMTDDGRWFVDQPSEAHERRIPGLWVDATPEGYALRILRAYRDRALDRWVRVGLAPEREEFWNRLDEIQRQRLAELEAAIAWLEKRP